MSWSRSSVKLNVAALFYQTEASLDWIRLDDGHRFSKYRQVGPEVLPNIQDLVFDGGIQLDQQTTPPKKQPMKVSEQNVFSKSEIRFRLHFKVSQHKTVFVKE